MKRITLSWLAHYQPNGNAHLDHQKTKNKLRRDKDRADRLALPLSDPLRLKKFIKFQ